MIEIRPAALADIALIEARPADREELWAAFRLEPRDALSYGVDHGSAHIGFIDGEPAALFGVTDYGRMGAPWAVFTAVVERKPKSFLAACRDPLRAFQAQYPYLVNYVDVRNTSAVRWLAWLGFTIHAPEPYGIDQMMFHRFDWCRPSV